MKKSILTRNQKKTFTVSTTLDGEKVDIVAEVRHDDECGNGHNSFAITGTIYKAGRRSDRCTLAGGCIHDEIAKFFPKLAPFIKWHLTSTDGPLHYVANTLYHARTCDTPGKQPGDPIKYDTRLAFTGIPFTFSEQASGFWDYLESVGDFDNIEITEVPYDGRDSYDFKPNYSLTGFIKENEVKQWYRAPFRTHREAQEFLFALREFGIKYVSTPVKWAKATTPNLEAARSCAVWPEAELEDFTSENLEARLPSLLEAFQHDVESLGLVY